MRLFKKLFKKRSKKIDFTTIYMADESEIELRKLLNNSEILNKVLIHIHPKSFLGMYNRLLNSFQELYPSENEESTKKAKETLINLMKFFYSQKKYYKHDQAERSIDLAKEDLRTFYHLILGENKDKVRLYNPGAIFREFWFLRKVYHNKNIGMGILEGTYLALKFVPYKHSGDMSKDNDYVSSLLYELIVPWIEINDVFEKPLKADRAEKFEEIFKTKIERLKEINNWSVYYRDILKSKF